jgi:hypothetical protein
MITLSLPRHERQPILESPGIPVDFTGASECNMGYAALETTQRSAFGRMWWTWDGKVFRYCHSLGTLLSGFGAANIAPANIAGVIPTAAAAGDREIIVTIASGDGYAGNGLVAKDELEGALLVCGHGESLVQNRTIMANAAVASGGGTCRILLDYPLANAMTAASSYVEVVLNPYKYLSKGAYEYHAFMCVPAVNASSGYNFWGQTRGPAWVCPGGGDGTPGDTANDRTAYFVGDGSVNFGYALTVESGYQRAGYCIDRTANGTSALPLIFLQLE